MTKYWAKIIFGALGIFAIGMAIVTAAEKASDQVRSIAETSDPVTIPFPFGIVPFKLDGTKLGTVERLTLLRDTPKGISNFRVVVKLGDSAESMKLARCLLVVDDPQHLDERTTFRCQNADTAGLNLVHYGEVTIEGSDASFPLLLPEAAVADLRSEGAEAEIEGRADSIAEAASALADSIIEVNMERADSIREGALERADSIRQEAFRLADSIRQRKAIEHPVRPARPRP